MSVDVVVWDLRGNSRSHRIAQALTTGARTAGYRATIKSDGNYDRPRGDIAAFYGYQKNMPRIMADYIERGKKVVFLDLGYWHRRQNGRWLGYHKVAVNARHSNAYLMDQEYKAARFKQFKIPILPWKSNGNSIIVAGMSAKSAESYMLKPQQWERYAVAELRKYTKRPIIYRPKPSWVQAKPIEGSEFIVEIDTAIIAIGNMPNPLVPDTTPDLPLNRWGNIVADETGKTGKERVFAGGDIVTGAATVIQAMGAGRTAAQSIHNFIKSKKR